MSTIHWLPCKPSRENPQAKTCTYQHWTICILCTTTYHWIRRAWTLQVAELVPAEIPARPMSVATLVNMLPQEARNRSRLNVFRLSSEMDKNRATTKIVAIRLMIDMVLSTTTSFWTSSTVKPPTFAVVLRLETMLALRRRLRDAMCWGATQSLRHMNWLMSFQDEWMRCSTGVGN
jgi:hypothetical protein